ncbi:MAG: hypothetical protein U0353_06185 [Sandaracinus sp.]
MQRLLALFALVLAVSCGGAPPAPVREPTPVVVAETPEPPPEPDRWVVPQHAVRSEAAREWDVVTQTEVVLSASGHLVMIDGPSGLVRSVDRLARRADPVTLVVGAGHGVLVFDTSDDRVSMELDLLDARARDAETELTAMSSDDGRALAVWPLQGGTLSVISRHGEDERRCELAMDVGPSVEVRFSADHARFAVIEEGQATLVATRDCHEERSLPVEGDGSDLVVASDDTTTDAEGDAESDAAPERARPEDTSGGQNAVHATWIRPDAEGIVVGQRGVSAVITRSGARVIGCVDGERDLVWSPAEPGVAYQGEDGRCDVGTGQGTLASPDPQDQYEYQYDATGDDEDEEDEPQAEEPPPDEVVCAPLNLDVCITLPERGPARLVNGEGARPRMLRGLEDAGVAFSPSGRYLGLSTRTSLRIVDVATGRDRLRVPAAEIVDFRADERWLVTTAEGRSTFRSLEDPALAFEIPHPLRAATVVFETGTETALACTDAGIERISLTDGARSTVAATPCRTIRVFGANAIVLARGEDVHRIVDLAEGRVLLEVAGELRAPPAGSSFFHTCDGHDLTVVDAARATRRTIAGACAERTIAEDGAFWARTAGLENIVLHRADGAWLELHLVWVGDAPHVYAEAADGAFWVPSADELAMMNVVTRVGDAISVARASDPGAADALYRPTLFADFVDGRPLPTASP